MDVTQAASSRRDRPKAIRISARPRMLERKWLISIRITGVKLASQRKRMGSDGVAPENSSITPTAAVRMARVHGANAIAAARNSRQARSMKVLEVVSGAQHSLFARG